MRRTQLGKQRLGMLGSSGPVRETWTGNLPKWNQCTVLALLTLLVAGASADLWRVWRSDSSLGHAPLVPIVAVYHLWLRRTQLREWQSSSVAGAALLGLCAVLHVGAYWADVEFVKPLSLIGIAFGLCWMHGGPKSVAVSAGALGFLLFTVPWPTTLIGRLQFPLQLISTSYAAMFAGIMGIPVHRDGVSLSVVPVPGRPPAYVILVAQQCSGLTSLIVLLALGYLIAYHTPVTWSKRALLFASTVPLALLANALRLTFILAAGARHGAAFAQWVHDHEQPVLVLLCSLGLMAIRAVLLRTERISRMGPHQAASEHTPPSEQFGVSDSLEAASPAQPEIAQRLASSATARWQAPFAMAALAFALAGSAWARQADSSDTPPRDFLAGLVLPYQGWSQQSVPLTAAEREMLQPDAQLLRRYQSPAGEVVEIAVVAGHRKKTVHTPDYCLAGGGWETISQSDVVIRVAGRRVDAVRALLTREGAQMMATYFFTDGDATTRSLPQFQIMQIARRMRARSSIGAMVRILTSCSGGPEAAERRTDDFARATLPAVFSALRNAAK